MPRSRVPAVVLVLVALVALPALALPPIVPPPSPAQAGAWEPVFDGEIPAVSIAVLRDGNVLYWSGADTHEASTVVPFLEPALKAKARILDLSAPTPRVRVPTPEDAGPGDIFCSFQTILADGQVLIGGGNRYATIQESGGFHLYGIDQTLRFEPGPDRFTEVGKMSNWRWYPTMLGLPDGDVLVFGGTRDLFDGGNIRQVERFDPASGAWSALPASADNLLPLYPHVHLVPSGPFKGQVVYVPGGCTSCTNDDTLAWNQVQTLDLATDRWTTHGILHARDYPASVLLPLAPPDYGASILSFGGGITDAIVSIDSTAADPLTAVLDLSTAPPTTRLASPTLNPRWYGHGILLPTGEVLAVGGMATGHKPAKQAPPVLQPELFHPDAVDPLTGLRGTWTPLADMTVARGYHSVGVLLPDARVLMGGFVPLSAAGMQAIGLNERRFEIFDPPYLFHGPRPVVTSVSPEARYGQPFTALTPQASADLRAVLVRPGATTHAVDTDQRLIELEVEARVPGGLALRAPPDAAIAPPGYYMLFLLQDHGQGPVPSLAKFVHLA